VSIKPAEPVVTPYTSTLPPPEMGSFEFARLSSLRAAQLMRGCTPLVSPSFTRTRTARREVAAGKVFRVPE